MKKLYRFYVDFGRQGDLDGLFVADDKDLEKALGHNVYFGEALGKHSEVDLVLSHDMFREVPVTEEAVGIIEKELGTTWSGWNPVEMYLDQEEERNG